VKLSPALSFCSPLGLRGSRKTLAKRWKEIIGFEWIPRGSEEILGADGVLKVGIPKIPYTPYREKV